MNEITAVLARLEGRGVRVWAEDGQLRYKGPFHADNKADLGWLSERKTDVLAHLVPPDFGRLPLSLSQRVWIRPPGAPPTAIEFRRTPALYLCKGFMDPDAMAAAIDQVITRHPILRTHYGWADGQAFQTVVKRAPPPMGRVDLSALTAQAHERAIWTVLKEVHDQPMNYGSAQPMRAWLFKLDEDQHLLATLIDHVALDNRSINLVHLDIFDHYHARTMGEAARISAAPPPYADHILANLSRQGLDRTAANLGWWRDRFAGARPVDLRDPAKAGHDGPSARRASPIRIPPPLCEAAHDLAREQGLSIGMVLSAAIGVLLGQWARTNRVLAAHVLDDRPERFARTVGCFVRSAPFFLDLSGVSSPAGLLGRARQAYLDMLNPDRAIFAEDIPGLRRVMINLQTPRGKMPAPDDPDATPPEQQRTLSAGALTCRYVSLRRPLFDQMDLDVQILLKITPRLIGGQILYAANRVDGGKATWFAGSLPEVLEGMARGASG